MNSTGWAEITKIVADVGRIPRDVSKIIVAFFFGNHYEITNIRTPDSSILHLTTDETGNFYALIVSRRNSARILCFVPHCSWFHKKTVPLKYHRVTAPTIAVLKGKVYFFGEQLNNDTHEVKDPRDGFTLRTISLEYPHDIKIVKEFPASADPVGLLADYKTKTIRVITTTKQPNKIFIHRYPTSLFKKNCINVELSLWGIYNNIISSYTIHGRHMYLALAGNMLKLGLDSASGIQKICIADIFYRATNRGIKIKKVILDMAFDKSGMFYFAYSRATIERRWCGRRCGIVCCDLNITAKADTTSGSADADTGIFRPEEIDIDGLMPLYGINDIVVGEKYGNAMVVNSWLDKLFVVFL